MKKRVSKKKTFRVYLDRPGQSWGTVVEAKDKKAAIKLACVAHGGNDLGVQADEVSKEYIEQEMVTLLNAQNTTRYKLERDALVNKFLDDFDVLNDKYKNIFQ